MKRLIPTMSALLPCLFAACAAIKVENEEAVAAKAPISTMPICWRAEPGCSNTRPQQPGFTRETLVEFCNERPPRDFVTIALSGSCTKAAVFSGLALFYLEFLGCSDFDRLKPPSLCKPSS